MEEELVSGEVNDEGPCGFSRMRGRKGGREVDGVLRREVVWTSRFNGSCGDVTVLRRCLRRAYGSTVNALFATLNFDV